MKFSKHLTDDQTTEKLNDEVKFLLNRSTNKKYSIRISSLETIPQHFPRSTHTTNKKNTSNGFYDNNSHRTTATHAIVVIAFE